MTKEERKGFVGIVDAYSSGNYLAPEFKSRGWECVHIQSTPVIPAVAQSSFHSDDFAFHIIHSDDVESTLVECRRFNLTCVLVGCETGVELADKLSESLGLATNGITLSTARRDKFEMTQQVASRGIRVIPSLKTNNSIEALNWIVNQGWPIVLKPLRSAGTDSVISCNSLKEFQTAFNNVLGRHDQFGELIDEVLIQKQISGPEYIVDTVSRNGKHHVTNAWFIKKGIHNGHSFVCEYNELLDYEKADKLGLIDYAFSVIDSLEIKHGPCHTEILMTADGPVLVEIASRLHGAGFPIYSRNCVGYSQVDLTVDSYIDHQAFDKKSRRTYELSQKLVILELISKTEGVLQDLQYVEKIEKLPSFFKQKIDLKPGDCVEKTVDVFTSPGHVVLMHRDEAVIWRDYKQTRIFEDRGLYNVSTVIAREAG